VGEWKDGKFIKGKIISVHGEMLEGDGDDSLFGIKYPPPKINPQVGKPTKTRLRDRRERIKRQRNI